MSRQSAFARFSAPLRHLGAIDRGFAAFYARLGVILLVLTTVSLAGAQISPLVTANSVQGTGIHLVDADGASSGESGALVIDLSSATTFQIAALANPMRLVVDLDKVTFTGQAARAASRQVGPILGFRAGLFLSGQSRIVIDLARPALVERADFVSQAGATRLVLQVKASQAATFEARAREDHTRRLARPAVIEAPAPEASGKPLIVIDPGHGGVDPGASGGRGENEKDIVLAIGLSLRAQLLRSGKVRVAMTREDDRFVRLGDRVAFARGREAALFVSLHADRLSQEGEVRGASVYTLGDRASDPDAERAAEKENRADLLAGLDPDEEARGGVETILSDLARRETRILTHRVARGAVTALRHVAPVHKNPLRSAGFRVLRAPDVPSILVELGYLSNAEDLARMLDPARREALSEKLAEALEAFVLSERGTRPALAQPGEATGATSR